MLAPAAVEAAAALLRGPAAEAFAAMPFFDVLSAGQVVAVRQGVAAAPRAAPPLPRLPPLTPLAVVSTDGAAAVASDTCYPAHAPAALLVCRFHGQWLRLGDASPPLAPGAPLRVALPATGADGVLLLEPRSADASHVAAAAAPRPILLTRSPRVAHEALAAAPHPHCGGRMLVQWGGALSMQ